MLPFMLSPRSLLLGLFFMSHNYITDHLGSTRVVLNNAGSVLERYDYYPYGEKIDVSVASSGNTGKGNLGTQNGYFCPNSAILKLMGQKTTYLVRKRSYDGPVRTNRPAVRAFLIIGSRTCGGSS